MKSVRRTDFKSVKHLAGVLGNIPPRAQNWNPWWSPHVFDRCTRSQKLWLSSAVICFDLDNEPTPGAHVALTPELMRELECNTPTCGNLWHFTPRGMRLLFVLNEQCKDQDLYLKAAKGAETLVQTWLASAPGLEPLKNDSKVFKDCARLLFPPNGLVNGQWRKAEVKLISETEYCVHDLAELCPVTPALPAVVRPAPQPAADAGEASDFAEALARYNDMHRQDWGPSGMGRCPAHPDVGSACFGRLRSSEDKWCCFSSHHPEGCGRKSEDGAYYTGDAADLDAFLQGISVSELVQGKKAEQKASEDEKALQCIELWSSEVERQREVQKQNERVQFVKVVGREYEAVEFAERILSERGFYERGGLCVHVDNGKIITVNRDDTPTYVSKYIEWYKRDAKGNLIPIDPSMNFSCQVLKRSSFKFLKTLEMISRVPVLRPDGTWHATHGYDEKTRIFFWNDGGWGKLPEKVSLKEAMEAKDRLLELVQDFPFKADVDRSSWLASLLTPLMRPFYEGNTPLFAFSSTTPGSGKTLLAQIISYIISGQSAPVSQLNKDATEFQKELLSVLMSGVPIRLFDNVTGSIKSAPLEAILTSGGLFTGRILGKSLDATLPVNTTFYMTGNNISFDGDIFRRVVLCELAPTTESPELRNDFHIRDLKSYVKTNWKSLYKCTASIIQAWLLAGRPKRPQRPFGSFEQWSMVRDVILWLGEPDPVRKIISGSEGVALDSILMMLGGLERVYGRDPFTVFQVCIRVNAACEANGESDMPEAEACILQAATMASSVRTTGHSTLMDPVKISSFFRRIEGRLFNGMAIRRAGRTRENKTLWTICRQEEL